MKVAVYISSIVIGVFLGLWFVGTFVDYRVTLNGNPISNYSADQLADEMVNNGGVMADSSHFIVGGVEFFSISGSWFMIMAMVVVGVIPLIFSLLIFRFLKRRNGANKSVQPSADAPAD